MQVKRLRRRRSHSVVLTTIINWNVSLLTLVGSLSFGPIAKKRIAAAADGRVHGDGCETKLIYSQKQNKQRVALKRRIILFAIWPGKIYLNAAGARGLVGRRQLGILGEGPLPKVLSPLLRWRHLPSHVRPTLLLDQIKTINPPQSIIPVSPRIFHTIELTRGSDCPGRQW